MSPATRGAFRGLLLATALLMGGCGKIAGLFGIGGTDLSLTQKTAQEASYRSLVEAAAPTGTGASTTVTRIDLFLKVRPAAADSDGWSPVEAEVTEGSQEVDGQPRPGSLAGQKMTFRVSPQRAFDRWQGLAFPSGIELLELGIPKGRVRQGTQWTVGTKRAMLRLQDEVSCDRTCKFEGEGKLGNEDAWRISVTVGTVKKTLGNGGVLELAGSGEVWISKKDLRVLKATEVLVGRLVDEKVSKEPGRFTQAITIMDAALAPPRLASLLDAPPAAAAGGPAPASAKSPASAPPISPPGPAAKPSPAAGAVAPVSAGTSAAASTAAGALAERIVFVSRATGKREIWSVAPDGTGKRCLSGFSAEHWSPSLDPDGRTLACVSLGGKGANVWLVGLVGAERTALTEFGERDEIQASWCNGGQRVVFLRGGKLWAVHRDGYNLQSFSIGGRAVDLASTNATSQVAVVTNELNQNKIVLVDVLSGTVREMFEGDEPAWSADGSQLAFRSTDSITTANADGSGVRQVLKGSIADGPLLWEPGGKRIVVSKEENGQADIYMVETAVNGKVTRATFRGGVACAISPAADKVAYLLGGDLWIAAVDGNTQVPVTADGATELPVWWGKHYVPAP